MVIEAETGNTTRLEPILISVFSKQRRRRIRRRRRRRRREAENSNGERVENGDLLREAKLRSDEEGVSLLIKMGSMVAVAFVPAGGGTVDGLAEDARAPMLVAGAMCSARLQENEEDEVRGEGKSYPLPPIYRGAKRRFGIECAHDPP